MKEEGHMIEEDSSRKILAVLISEREKERSCQIELVKLMMRLLNCNAESEF